MTKFSHRFYNLYRHIIDVLENLLIHADLDFKYTDFTNFYIYVFRYQIYFQKKR